MKPEPPTPNCHGLHELFTSTKQDDWAPACGRFLALNAIAAKTQPQETTNASRPRTNGVGAPVQGLRRPIGDDRLMHSVPPRLPSRQEGVST